MKKQEICAMRRVHYRLLQMRFLKCRMNLIPTYARIDNLEMRLSKQETLKKKLIDLLQEEDY